MQFKAVALEQAYDGDIAFIRHLVRESGIILDEQDEVRMLGMNG